MKNLYLIFLLYTTLLFSQEGRYKYYLTVSSVSNLPEFVKIGDQYFYEGKDEGYRSFFNDYTIHYYELAFPKCPFVECPYIYEVYVSEDDFIDNLLSNFPSVYVDYEDISHINPVLQYYPNDYGTTSPIYNWSPFERRELDYIEVANAWDITTGVGL